ncbi:MAG: glycosyltransferase family 4 protein [Candidatus Eremiobacteraeota bacterium]|nr:glycosyltransferase family 4 protein [Candidatus Eremiobacteraeota bacterium]
MKIAVDAQLALGTATGIGEYVTGLVAGLREAGVDVAELREPRLDPWRFDRRIVWDQLLLPLAARQSGADLLHCTSGTMPLLGAMPAVVTVHDVAWLRAQRHTRRYARYYFGTFSLARYRRARRIVVDSAFSRGELLEFLGTECDRASVVYPGVARDYCALVRRPDEPAFILAVGTVEARKNLAVVVRALADLAPDVRLVVAGPPTPYQAHCKHIASALGVSERIDWRGYVSRKELLALYARAAVAVVPSTYEGFGYAAAQAMCAGVPLLVSNASSLPEIVGEHAVCLPPTDTYAWAQQLNTILNGRVAANEDAHAAREGAIRRFAWAASIVQLRAVYADALEDR